MGTDIRIVLKSGKDQSVMRRHPWLFSGAIKKIHGNPSDGDLVNVYNNKDEFLAIGHYQNGTIAVRILDFNRDHLDEDFWKFRFADAYRLRKTLGLTDSSDTNVYRLIHAEGDNLPGLIADYYNGHVVIQLHSSGMNRNIKEIFSNLQQLYKDKIVTVYNKSETTLPFNERDQGGNAFLLGNSTDTIVTENALKFHVNWSEGQKTGFFIDQRENRKLLKEYAYERDVLNLFCYSGAFSVYALSGGARKVHSVDSSAKIIELAVKNSNLNFPGARHEAFTEDAFKFMDGKIGLYDMIVLDPPAFAKHQNVLHNALQGYKRLNQRALEIIRKGGIIFTFSCSQVVTKENFRKSVFAAAANARRSVKILHQLGQPSDHPVNIYHPEGEYLKGLVLYVD